MIILKKILAKYFSWGYKEHNRNKERNKTMGHFTPTEIMEDHFGMEFLDTIEKHFVEDDDRPVSFNPFTGNVGYEDCSSEFHNVYARGFKIYSDCGHAISGMFKSPVLLGATSYFEGENAFDSAVDKNVLYGEVAKVTGPIKFKPFGIEIAK